MAVSPIDQGSAIQNLLISQYKDRPNMSGLLQNLAEGSFQDIENQAYQIVTMCDIANATGNVLDAVGILIGLQRMKVKISGVDVWQYDYTPFTLHQFIDGDFLVFEEAPDDIYRDTIRCYSITRNSFGDLRTLQKTLMLLYGFTEDTDLTITQPSAKNVNIVVNVAPDPRRRYLVDEYKAPNASAKDQPTSALWAKVAGCVYTFTYPV